MQIGFYGSELSRRLALHPRDKLSFVGNRRQQCPTVLSRRDTLSGFATDDHVDFGDVAGQFFQFVLIHVGQHDDTIRG